MLRQMLQQQFGISAEESLKIGAYEAWKKNNELYMVVPVGNINEEDLLELESVADHLIKSGDTNTFNFLKNQEGKQLVEWQEGKYCVLHQGKCKPINVKNLGRKLAKFHYRGRSISFTVNKTSRIGQWKQLWERRLDQMEKVWNEMLFQTPENEFHRMFLESFPYYMGLAENSIQYLVDTELDEEPLDIDNGTVCHERFSSRLWGNQVAVKNPFDWVFDHCSRDLAEWTRERYFENIQTYQPDLRKFFTDYQGITPLSSFSWRLLYARLMFPLHFFECVEGYYMTGSEQQKNALEDRFTKYLSQTREHELFLANFFQIVEVPVRKFKLPKPEWLGR